MNAPPERLGPADAEALELMMRLAGRVMVARSFARIAGGMIAESASRAIAEVAPVARAAVEAAVHVTTSRLPYVAPPEKAKKRDREETSRPRIEDEDEPAPSSLDHEALHDDAC